MSYDRFLIGFTDGQSSLQTDLKPWLIADNAWAKLQNAYVFRGRVRKRFGATIMGSNILNSRLKVNIGTTGSGAPPGTISSTVLGNIFAIGQMFSVGTDLFTVFQTGTPAAMLASGAGTGVYDTSNGQFTISGVTNNTTVYWYPATPVMGLTQYEIGLINNHPAYAFDTQFAYVFNNNQWIQSPGANSPVFHGTDLDFFWITNWKGANASTVVMWVTNYFVTVGVPGPNDDPIWTFDGTTWVARIAPGANGIYFNPAPGTPPIPKARYTGPYVKSARIIVPFKDRLLLLSTIENENPAGNGTGGTNVEYPQRCRYSINGSPFAQNAWYEPNQKDSSGTANGLSNAAGAGFVDATTDERIISAEFIKDRLIVYFERSTWELVYTGNEVFPFRWQKINTELGSQSLKGTVPFDTAVLTIGNTGVHSCSGAQVQRIDNKIPDEVFDFEVRNSATNRIAGIRDYFTELVYWTFNSSAAQSNQTYPNQILVYNYQNGSWAINDDTFTAFGYFEQQVATTWATATTTWAQSNFQWESIAVNPDQRQIIAGNQEGFVCILQPDVSRNAPMLQITNIEMLSPNNIITITAINHNLEEGDFVLLQGIIGTGNLNLLNNKIFQVYNLNPLNSDRFNIVYTQNPPPPPIIAGVYAGGGTITRVSNIQMLSKQWNPYVNKGRNLYLAKADFLVDRTVSGAITVDYYPSSSELSLVTAGKATNSIIGNNVLETFPYALVPLEAVQDRLWHTVYFQGDGESIQLSIYMSVDQMIDPNISLSEFELNGIVIFTQPTSSRLQ